MSHGRTLSGRHLLIGTLAVLATVAEPVVRGGSTFASAPNPSYIDFTSSSPVGPGATLTLTANLPATLKFDAGDGVVQSVSLLGATLIVTTLADSPASDYYKAARIVRVTANVGPFLVAGREIGGADIFSVEPGSASINYARGALMANMRLRASAPGFPVTVATAYTSGQVISPTTVRLFMDGNTILEPKIVPTMSVWGAFGMALLLFMMGSGVILRRLAAGASGRVARIAD
jgi:hypothetical protein